jgi:hypothetical protein
MKQRQQPKGISKESWKVKKAPGENPKITKYIWSGKFTVRALDWILIVDTEDERLAYSKPV